jgi:hypothetical protein
MTDFGSLTAGLRAWAEGDWVCSAAVELLIAGGTWIRRDDFLAACIDQEDEDFALIRWDDARAFAAAVTECSDAESGFLRLAVAIGSDEYRLVSVDEEKRAAIVRAFATAARMRGMLHG